LFPPRLLKPWEIISLIMAGFLKKIMAMFRCFAETVLTIDPSQIHGIEKSQKTIIRAFGAHAEEIYGYP